MRNDNDIRNLLDRKEGWVPTLALATGMRVDAPPPPKERPNRGGGKGAGARPEAPTLSLAEQVAAAETRLARVRAKGTEKEKAQLPAIEKQVAALKQRQADQVKEIKALGGARKVDPAALIREAYLRTVCRPPTKDEMEIAKAYLSESRSPLAGLRDVLWALINTKEFITNH